jgi:hypothetical protein
MKGDPVKRSALRRRMLQGLLSVVLLLGAIGATWLCIDGESYFSLTRRLPAEVLVTEGWIGRDGVRAAAEEFEKGGYQYVVLTGGLDQEQHNRVNYALIAEQELIGLGIPKDKIIAAPSWQVERQRTFESAGAAFIALQTRGVRPKMLNVFTLGPHARRSRLVYEKVFTSGTKVGVVAFVPPSYQVEPWWQSKGRTKCLLKEVVGYPFEILLNAGRLSNSPVENPSRNSESPLASETNEAACRG